MERSGSVKTTHPTTIPSFLGSALIVSTDDHTLTDILLVVTDIFLYCIMASVSELPCTVQYNLFPIPSHVKLALLSSEDTTGEGGTVILALDSTQTIAKTPISRGKISIIPAIFMERAELTNQPIMLIHIVHVKQRMIYAK